MMRVSFRLKQFLEERRDYRHGIINELAEGTDIPRQQIAALLKNRVKYVSLEALGAICNYLARTYHLDQTQLPGMLFALEPSGFLALLGSHEMIEICFGIRHDKDWHELISASDADLQRVLLKELFGVGRDRHMDDRRHFLEQRLVPAYDKSTKNSVARKQARGSYDAFHRRGGARTLICLGSIKSNVLVEILMANAFAAEPFVAEDGVATPDKRRCPIFFRLREKDPRPISCYAGMRPARSVRRSRPGIYFETESGKWDCCPCTETEDAALVLFVHRRGSGVLEVVMGGFSGRATKALAKTLPNITDKLWPPSYDHNDLAIGAFIVRFAADAAGSRKGRAKRKSSENGADQPELAFEEVITLSGQVIGRRLQGDKPTSKVRA